MAHVIVRMWNADGYHKDVAVISEKQIHMSYAGMEATCRHLEVPVNAHRVVVDPKAFPEAVEFEVIVLAE